MIPEHLCMILLSVMLLSANWWGWASCTALPLDAIASSVLYDNCQHASRLVLQGLSVMYLQAEADKCR